MREGPIKVMKSPALLSVFFFDFIVVALLYD
jgi:hypothetical protein